MAWPFCRFPKPPLVVTSCRLPPGCFATTVLAEGVKANERARECPAAVAIAFEQVEGHALSRFRPHAREHAQGLDEA